MTITDQILAQYYEAVIPLQQWLEKLVPVEARPGLLRDASDGLRNLVKKARVGIVAEDCHACPEDDDSNIKFMADLVSHAQERIMEKDNRRRNVLTLGSGWVSRPFASLTCKTEHERPRKAASGAATSTFPNTIVSSCGSFPRHRADHLLAGHISSDLGPVERTPFTVRTSFTVLPSLITPLTCFRDIQHRQWCGHALVDFWQCRL